MTKVKVIFFLLGALLILLNPITTHAQITKGSFLLGGSGSFSSTKTKTPLNVIDETKITSLELAPKAGYFLVNNLSLGVLLPLGIGKTVESNANNLSYPGQEKINQKFYGIGPFARYYVPVGKMYIFGEASYYFAKRQSVFVNVRDQINQQLGDLKINEKINSYQLGVGAAYFVAKNVSIEAALGFTNQKQKSSSDDFDVLNIDVDQSRTYLNIGLQFILVK